MDEKAFFDLCYEEYKIESSKTLSIYTVASLALTVLTGLGVAFAALARSDWLHGFATVPEVFLYYLSLFVGFGVLLAAFFHLQRSIVPVHGYKTLRKVADLRSELGFDNKPSGDGYRVVTGYLCTAHSANQEINERRRRCLRRAMRCIACGTLILFVTAFFHAVCSTSSNVVAKGASNAASK
jgi:hypothetical protein